MKQCGLIKLSPPASSSSQDTLLMLVQKAFNTSIAHNNDVATVILYEDRLYYADTKGVVRLIETAMTEELSNNRWIYYDFLIDYDLLKSSITDDYRLANLDELKLANTILGVTPKANEPALTNAVIGAPKQRRHLPLRDDEIDVIVEYLTPKEKLRLALSGSVYLPSRLFSDRQQTLINRLIEFTLQGNQAKVEQMLRRHPEYATIKGTATDYSGRKFINVSAFECALWALDTRYMCNMMLDCLPNNPQGEAIKQVLLAQFNAQKQFGVLYEINGVTTREAHYNFSPLIEALQTYVNRYEEWYAANNWDAMRDQFSKVVGLAQRYVPAHVAQHYCEPGGSFIPTPPFNKKTFKRSLELYNFITERDEFWFAPTSSTSGLGVDFGILRAGGERAGGRGIWRTCHLLRADLAAMTALCKVRTKDLDPLMQRLESPIQKPDVDPETPQCVIS